MNRSEPRNRFRQVLLFGILILLLTPLPVAAAGDTASWRPIYDLIMRWVNFGILVFFIVKYGRRPLMNFLKGQQSEIANGIDEVENRKNIILQQIRDTEKKIKQSSRRFEKIKQRIIQEGEREKDKIIDNARELSKNMLEIEKKKALTRISSARNLFMAELVDAAMEFAQKRLPSEMTETDQEKMLAVYLSNINRMAG